MSILVSLTSSDKKEIEDVSRKRYINYDAKEGYQEGCFKDWLHSDRGIGNYGEKIVSKASEQIWNNESWKHLSFEEREERQKTEHDVGEICEVRFTQYNPGHLIVRPQQLIGRGGYKYYDSYKIICPYILVTPTKTLELKKVGEESEFLIQGWIICGDAFRHKNNPKSRGDGSCWVHQNELIQLNNSEQLKKLISMKSTEWQELLREANKIRQSREIKPTITNIVNEIL